MQATKLRFRNAKVVVSGDITVIRGELLNMDRIATQVKKAIYADEDFIDKLRDVVGDANYVDFTVQMMNKLSPEQLSTVLGWFAEQEGDSGA